MKVFNNTTDMLLKCVGSDTCANGEVMVNKGLPIQKNCVLGYIAELGDQVLEVLLLVSPT